MTTSIERTREPRRLEDVESLEEILMVEDEKNAEVNNLIKKWSLGIGGITATIVSTWIASKTGNNFLTYGMPLMIGSIIAYLDRAQIRWGYDITQSNS